MSKNDPQIIPPNHSLPAKAQGKPVITSQSDPALPVASSAGSSALTGFQARMQTRALNDIAANIRARTGVQDAETARRESALKLLRTVHKLEEAPEICDLDRAERKAERAAKYAALRQNYNALEENRDEHAHQLELRKLAREAQIEAAKRVLTEAQRTSFNSEQGFENQRRLKDLNLQIFESRKRAVALDAEAVAANLRAEATAKAENDSAPDARDAVRAQAEAALIAAAQRGDAAAVDRWGKVLDALDGTKGNPG